VSQEAATASSAEPRARGGALSSAAAALACGLRRRAVGRPCRVAAGLGLEPESGSRSGTSLTGESHPSA
jgi:hypothetical protein